MRRIIIAVAVLIFIFCGCTLAEGPVNPYLKKAQAPMPILIPRSDRILVTGVVAGSVLDFDSIDQAASWRATAYYQVPQINPDTGDVEIKLEGGQFEYSFYLTMPENGKSVTHCYKAFSNNRVFNYDFVIPGQYHLWVYAQDEQGRTARAVYNVSVNDDNALNVEEKIDQIISQCKKAGCKDDYEKALWLHDWLINNSAYDHSLSYYSIDGVLIRGTGVCDSYSKAYVRLLAEMGIEAQYLPSSDMNHSWNLVKLNGKWYHVDVTWDDATPKGITDPVCGYEKHIYFGLTDGLMAYDHTFVPSKSCTSYDDNYFIRTGFAQNWLLTLEEDAQAKLNGGHDRFSLTPPKQYVDEYRRYASQHRDIVYGLAAHALSQMEWNTGSDELLNMEITHDKDADKIHFILRLGSNVLRLPAALAKIDDYAFAGGEGFAVVELPEGILSIGEGAFSNCKNLWNIHIPASVQFISETAFENSPNVNIICQSGSYAETYAKQYMPDHYRIQD